MEPAQLVICKKKPSNEVNYRLTKKHLAESRKINANNVKQL